MNTTAAPWRISEKKSYVGVYGYKSGGERCVAMCGKPNGDVATEARANAHLIAAAPELLAALHNVRKLISEAAMTGFNWRDGDWAERLFLSQQQTSAAIDKAESRP